MAKKANDEPLCKLVKKGKMKKAAELVKGAGYMCMKCGRGAAKQANLCKPERR